MHRTFAVALALAAVAAQLAACKGHGGGADDEDRTPVAVVGVATPTRSLVPETVQGFGTVAVPPDRLAVIASTTGGRVMAFDATVGTRVHEGQVLVRLSADPAVRADAAKADTALEQARRALERQQRLYAAGVVAGVAVEDAKAAYRSAEADAEAKRQALSLSEANSVLRAPLSGTITDASVSVGLVVAPQTPLLSVADLSTVWVDVQVDPDQAAHLHIGQPVAIKVAELGGARFEGRVDGMGRGVGADTQRMVVHVSAPNPKGALQPGMYAEAAIRAGEHPGLLVPRSAVVDHQGETAVFEAVGGHAVVRTVRVGPPLDDEVEIRSGLSPTASVIVKGTYGLTDQAPIKVGVASASDEGAAPEKAGAPEGGK